ncbi:hypothetical protein Anapl_04723 [Anas platyrhynchos]|uniref:Uncharacterized protein n=1 Tax=Anas platyrhynchos TaxID=8839 RepID=R0K2N9_ANAPL|nr:hypothetical protein Anapl_04723 [Anas platyrhynchos]
MPATNNLNIFKLLFKYDDVLTIVPLTASWRILCGCPPASSVKNETTTTQSDQSHDLLMQPEPAGLATKKINPLTAAVATENHADLDQLGLPFSVTQSINQAVAEAGGPTFSCPTVLTQSLYLDTRLLLPGMHPPLDALRISPMLHLDAGPGRACLLPRHLNSQERTCIKGQKNCKEKRRLPICAITFVPGHKGNSHMGFTHTTQMHWSVWAHAREKAPTSQVLPGTSMARHGMAWPSPCPMSPSQQQHQEPTQCHPQHWEEPAGRKRHRRASSEQIPRVNNVASLAKAVRPAQIKENPTLAWLPNKPKAVVCGQRPFMFYICFNYTWAHLFWFLDPLLVVLPTACCSPKKLSAPRARKICNYLIQTASDCFALFQVKLGKWGQHTEKKGLPCQPLALWPGTEGKGVRQAEDKSGSLSRQQPALRKQSSWQEMMRGKKPSILLKHDQKKLSTNKQYDRFQKLKFLTHKNIMPTSKGTGFRAAASSLRRDVEAPMQRLLQSALATVTRAQIPHLGAETEKMQVRKSDDNFRHIKHPKQAKIIQLAGNAGLTACQLGHSDKNDFPTVHLEDIASDSKNNLLSLVCGVFPGKRTHQSLYITTILSNNINGFMKSLDSSKTAAFDEKFCLAKSILFFMEVLVGDSADCGFTARLRLDKKDKTLNMNFSESAKQQHVKEEAHTSGAEGRSRCYIKVEECQYKAVVSTSEDTDLETKGKILSLLDVFPRPPQPHTPMALALDGPVLQEPVLPDNTGSNLAILKINKELFLKAVSTATEQQHVSTRLRTCITFHIHFVYPSISAFYPAQISTHPAARVNEKHKLQIKASKEQFSQNTILLIYTSVTGTASMEHPTNLNN